MFDLVRLGSGSVRKAMARDLVLDHNGCFAKSNISRDLVATRMDVLRVFFFAFLALDASFSYVHAATIAGVEGRSDTPSAKVDARLITADALRSLAEVAIRKIDDGSVSQALTKSSHEHLTSLISLFVSAAQSSQISKVYNAIFLVASALMLIAFVTIAVAVRKYKLIPEPGQKTPTKVAILWVSINIMFLLSAILWLLGFCLVVRELQSFFNPEKPDISGWVATFLPLYLKIAGAVFLTLQPMTALGTLVHLGGVSWSNTVGVVLFHLGNLMTLFGGFADTVANPDMKFFDMSNPARKNVVLHIFYTIGTSLLLTGGHIMADKVSTPPVDSIWLQIAGSSALLLGSILALIDF